MSKNKKETIEVEGKKLKILSDGLHEEEYIYLSDNIKHECENSLADIIRNWIR